MQTEISDAKKTRTRTQNTINFSLQQKDQKPVGKLFEIYRPTHVQSNKSGKNF
jgi:hypothetical protein